MPTFTEDFESAVSLQTGATPLPEDEPFRLLLLGNWSGKNSASADLAVRHPLEIDRDNFAEMMWKLNVALDLDLNGDGQDILSLQFNKLDDFHPDSIFHQVSLFSNLRETRRGLLNKNTFNQTAREVRDWIGGSDKEESAPAEAPADATESAPPASGNLLDQILFQADESLPLAKRKPKNELDELIGKLVKPHLINFDETEQSKLVAAVDDATSELMRKILHNPNFQALEAAWRGAYLVVSRAETDSFLRIYLFEMTKDELTADLKSGELSDSVFCRLLDNDKSFAAVFGNYNFTPNVDDAAALMRIAKISRAFETPFISHGRPDFLGAKSLAETPDSDDWHLAENSPAAKLWAMLRALPEAASLGLAVPRFMARLPYGADSEPTEHFAFEELTAPFKHEEYLWANPCFAIALLFAQSFTAYGWELKRGFVQDIENLPMHLYTEAGAKEIKPCSEAILSQKAADKILDNGLMPIVSFRDRDTVRLLKLQSISDPPQYVVGKW